MRVLAAGVSLLLASQDQASVLGPMDPQVAYAKVMLGVAVLFQGHTHRAGELMAECRTICQAHGDQWYLGLVLFNSAMQALALPDLAQAAAYARRSLELRREFHDAYGAAAGLETLAWIAAIDHDHRRAARLLGAADRQWRRIGGSPLASGPLRHGRDTNAAARAALGDAAFDAEHRRGAQLTDDDAFAYAFGQPGPRADDASPADSGTQLTRREREVAVLVADGLTNRQIAARLVISRRTAETHVQHILAKSGFTSRIQLVARYAGRPDRAG